MATGEWVTRIYASFETWRDLLNSRPADLKGGCKTPMRETATTCVTYSINDVARWLRSQGIRLEVR